MNSESTIEPFEMSVFIYSITWYNIPEHLNLHQYCCEKLHHM